MSSKSRSESGGGSAAIVVIVLLCGLAGLVVVAGGGALFLIRNHQRGALFAQERAEMLLAQQAERMAVESQLAAQKAAAAQQQAAAAEIPEILVEISAAGDYKLAGKAMEYYDDLKAALLEAHFAEGTNLQVVISADKETRFDKVSKAVEAAECAGITRHRILTPSSPPVSGAAADPVGCREYPVPTP